MDEGSAPVLVADVVDDNSDVQVIPEGHDPFNPGVVPQFVDPNLGLVEKPKSELNGTSGVSGVEEFRDKALDDILSVAKPQKSASFSDAFGEKKETTAGKKGGENDKKKDDKDKAATSSQEDSKKADSAEKDPIATTNSETTVTNVSSQKANTGVDTQDSKTPTGLSKINNYFSALVSSKTNESPQERLLNDLGKIIDRIRGGLDSIAEDFPWLNNIVEFVKTGIRWFSNTCERLYAEYLKKLNKQKSKAETSDKKKKTDDEDLVSGREEEDFIEENYIITGRDGEEIPIIFLLRDRPTKTRQEKMAEILFGLGEAARREDEQEDAEQELEQHEDQSDRQKQVYIVNALHPDLEDSDFLIYYEEGGIFVEEKPLDYLITAANQDAEGEPLETT